MPLERADCVSAAHEALLLAANTPLGPLATNFRLFLDGHGEVVPQRAPAAPASPSASPAAVTAVSPAPRRVPYPPPLHLTVRCMDCRKVRDVRGAERAAHARDHAELT
jgi:hypothetical protein